MSTLDPPGLTCWWSEWSAFINMEVLDTGNGDTQSCCAREKYVFCGRNETVTCQTKYGNSSSYGALLLCPIQNGSVCLKAENKPMQCSDYMIQYSCKRVCRASSPTVSPPAFSLCYFDEWSAWINTDTPDTGDGDRESPSDQEKLSLCRYWSYDRYITAVECQTVNGTAFNNTGEKVQCSIQNGSVCLKADNNPNPCSDYMIRYFCSCRDPFFMAPMSSIQTNDVTTGTPTVTATIPTRPQCVDQWSTWINTDTPDTGDGDRESWSCQEKDAFCPTGTITAVECQTIAGIHFYNTCENVQCSIQNGSVCRKYPRDCSDYQIRYFCSTCSTCPFRSRPVSSIQIPEVSTCTPAVMEPSPKVANTTSSIAAAECVISAHHSLTDICNPLQLGVVVGIVSLIWLIIIIAMCVYFKVVRKNKIADKSSQHALFLRKKTNLDINNA
ncbi:mucin-5B-like [Dreissena polymorpha]|uniref:mucin-5B-like n=1 Tax=Dreissena polymorpha TaxID=45954 RepID=UPI002264C005|nr:mucin-5B-like [Dreissena polymorpha]